MIISGEHTNKIKEIKQIKKTLQRNNEIFVFLRNGEPNTKRIQSAINLIQQKSIDSIFGIGGGSTMDFAKICSIANNTELKQIIATGKIIITSKKRKLVLIPTTAGSGVDALIHATEAIISPKATVTSNEYVSYTIKNIHTRLRPDYTKNTLDRNKMTIVSYCAGRAIALAGAGANHAMSYPLSNRFHFIYGYANAILFTGTIAYYIEYNLVPKKNFQNSLRQLQII